MSYSTCIETLCAIINIHIILLSNNGHLRRKFSLVSLALMIFVLIFSMFPQTLAGKIAIGASIPMEILLPILSIKGIRISGKIYVSLFYMGFTSALVMPLAWVFSSFVSAHTLIMGISAVFNIALTVLCIYLSKKGILGDIVRHADLVSKRIKIIILISIWTCALLIFLMAELFYEFPKTGPLILIQVLVALVISIIGISEPLLIINNIAGAYYKSISSSIRKQMEQQVKYYDRLYQTDNELRRFKHDYKNLRIGLISQLKNNNVAAALQYLESSERPYAKNYITFETGNAIADALFSEKQLEANEYNAMINFEGFIPSDLIDPCDICIILGNALDNAIEACSAGDDTVEKQIYVESHMNNNFLFLSISNPSFTPVAINNNRIRTTKKDKASHGMGLYAIEHSVKRYSGEINLSWKENIFQIDICMDFNIISTQEIA